MKSDLIDMVEMCFLVSVSDVSDRFTDRMLF